MRIIYISIKCNKKKKDVRRKTKFLDREIRKAQERMEEGRERVILRLLYFGF